MANEKWTPGPWRIDGSLAIYSADDSFIADVTYLTDEKEQANANLIAAAPELYEALNDLLNEAINGTVPLLAQIEKVSKVLRKARGEDSE